MASGAARLDARRAGPATDDQQSAIDELEKIWEAVIPFHALLARDLADQTQIARSLEPAASTDSKAANGDAAQQSDDDRAALSLPVPLQERQGDRDLPLPLGEGRGEGASETSLDRPASAGPPSIATEDDSPQLSEMQERTRRRTQLLKLKAEAELDRLEKAPPPQSPPAAGPGNGSHSP